MPPAEQLLEVASSGTFCLEASSRNSWPPTHDKSSVRTAERDELLGTLRQLRLDVSRCNCGLRKAPLPLRHVAAGDFACSHLLLQLLGHARSARRHLTFASHRVVAGLRDRREFLLNGLQLFQQVIPLCTQTRYLCVLLLLLRPQHGKLRFETFGARTEFLLEFVAGFFAVRGHRGQFLHVLLALRAKRGEGLGPDGEGSGDDLGIGVHECWLLDGRQLRAEST
mmetsp:Transcript_85417/g.238409  ORF Transcript_85417/g.238409 Transcript_85417/m.238409 type:complete len:224 (+) Transcript_85417:582-1253(+)